MFGDHRLHARLTPPVSPVRPFELVQRRVGQHLLRPAAAVIVGDQQHRMDEIPQPLLSGDNPAASVLQWQRQPLEMDVLVEDLPGGEIRIRPAGGTEKPHPVGRQRRHDRLELVFGKLRAGGVVFPRKPVQHAEPVAGPGALHRRPGGQVVDRLQAPAHPPVGALLHDKGEAVLPVELGAVGAQFAVRQRHQAHVR